MKILVTGANGFTASHLIPIIKVDACLFLTDVKVKDTKDYYLCDLTDFMSTYDLLKKIKPEQIYHLAGTFTNDYDIDYKVNVLTTRNILESCFKLKLNCRTLLIGSAAEYGIVSEKDNPVKEEHPLNPVSIYGLTKLYQTSLMNYYYFTHKLDIVMARTFNLMGRGISNKLFIGRVYEQIEEYKKGNISKISLGNLQNKRDYIDIQESIRYYRLIMNNGISGEVYNVGSGKSIKIYNLLQEILKEHNLTIDIVEENIINKPERFDIKNIYADTRKILKILPHNGLYYNKL